MTLQTTFQFANMISNKLIRTKITKISKHSNATMQVIYVKKTKITEYYRTQCVFLNLCICKC